MGAMIFIDSEGTIWLLSDKGNEKCSTLAEAVKKAED